MDIFILTTILSGLGFSLVLKDYVACFFAGMIMHYVKQIRPGRRIKILTTPTVKGDVVTIGLIRTTLIEVGDGERLPSVETGRLIKIPNFMLLNNPVLIYGDTIVDEVIAYVSEPYGELDVLINDMSEAIASQGHKVVEVGLYQKESKLAVHGIFESKADEIADMRSRILKSFLQKHSIRAIEKWK